MPRTNLAFYLARIFLLLLAVAAAGCATVEPRFQEARDHSAQGRHLEAVAYYLAYLNKHPADEAAGELLRETASLVFAVWIDSVDSAMRAFEYSEALEHLNKIGELVQEVNRVGISLPLSAEVATRRDEALDQMLTELLEQADGLRAAAEWEEAMRVYDVIEATIPESEELAATLLAERSKTQLSRIERKIEQERYRQALDLSEEMLATATMDASTVGRVRFLQDITVDTATRRVAFLPFWPETGLALPTGLLDEVYNLLFAEYLDDLPLFIDAVEYSSIQRETMRLRIGRREIPLTDAAEIGRVLDADVVVILVIQNFTGNLADTRDGRARTADGSRSLQGRIELMNPFTEAITDAASIILRGEGRGARFTLTEIDIEWNRAQPSNHRLTTEESIDEAFTHAVARHFAELVLKRISESVE